MKVKLKNKNGELLEPTTTSASVVMRTGETLDVEFSKLNNNKQSVLVSGLNIKTINDQSLLGAGNIEIQSSSNVEWGSIDGDIEDQTDLINKLDDKQDTLVSGTNIKTINNESILGSGNITISEGTTDYNDLENKPSINNIELTGNLTTSELGIDIPTKVSDLTNDLGFITGINWTNE